VEALSLAAGYIGRHVRHWHVDSASAI